jgi:hypothetical protein
MSLATKLGLGTLCALAVTILTLAVWPASEADKARDDGERIGAAVSALYAADSTDAVDDAVADLEAAAADTRTHAADRFDEQIDDLDAQFSDTREDAPEVVQAFWDGFDSALTTNA